MKDAQIWDILVALNYVHSSGNWKYVKFVFFSYVRTYCESTESMSTTYVYSFTSELVRDNKGHRID